MVNNCYAFRTLAIQKARELHPDWKVTPDGFGVCVEAGAYRAAGGLEHAYERALSLPHRTDETLATFIGGLASMLAEQEAPLEETMANLCLAPWSLTVYESQLDEPISEQLPFVWKALPDVGIYWAIGYRNVFRLPTRGEVELWGLSAAEITRIAWGNTVAAAKENTELVRLPSGEGLVVSPRGRIASIGHLLYWRPALVDLLRTAMPSLLDKQFLLCAPAPYTLAVLAMSSYDYIAPILQTAAQAEGSLLSENVYVLFRDQLLGKVIGKEGRKINVVRIRDRSFGSQDYPTMPYVPT